MTANQKLLDLVNEENSPAKLLTLINVTLSEPTYDGEVRDARVTISGVPGRGYKGQVDVTYARIPLSLVAPSAHLRSTTPFTPEMVVSMLNKMFNIAAVVDDFEPFSVPVLELGVPQNLTLTVKANSVGYNGAIDVEFLFGRTLLESVIGVRVLPELKHPIVPGPRQCARMLTWDRDFTSVRDAFKLTAGKYADFSTLLLAAAYYGIPSWAEGSATDRATSDVPDSNPKFNRVVIQPDVSSGYITGDVYLHYNTFDEA